MNELTATFFAVSPSFLFLLSGECWCYWTASDGKAAEQLDNRKPSESPRLERLEGSVLKRTLKRERRLDET